jgi:hypothetical protein
VSNGDQLRAVRESARLQEAEVEATVAAEYPGPYYLRHRKREDTDLERAETDDRDRLGPMPQPGTLFAQMGRLETPKAETMEAMLKIAASNQQLKCVAKSTYPRFEQRTHTFRPFSVLFTLAEKIPRIPLQEGEKGVFTPTRFQSRTSKARSLALGYRSLRYRVCICWPTS